MKDQYELTVIISNFNQEQHLAQTIDSVLTQRMSFPYRIIITDDHSIRDRSREIIRDYASKYDNIEVLFSDENTGYLANILRAKERTKTKYFCLLDADDYWIDRHFLQRAYDFLETHEEYSIYEANVKIVSEGNKKSRRFISGWMRSGTYSKDIYVSGEAIPVTQTTGMVLRNCIFSDGIPEIMKNAVGTRSERSFEGDTGRFIMHLKYGFAYYDRRVVGVYRVTENGIWTRLSDAKKNIITARFYPDYYEFYGSDRAFFVNRAYICLQGYLTVKQKELGCMQWQVEFMDDYEREMFEDVYLFCKKYESDIIRKKPEMRDKLRRILRIIRE